MTVLEHLENIKDHLRRKGAADDWLNPGASPQAIADAEAQMDLKLPEEWRALYARHDGEKEHLGLFLGFPWMPLSQVVAEWKNWKTLEADYGDEGTHFSIPPLAIKEKYVNTGWVPLSQDWGGNHLGIDLAPGPKGQPGQFINFGRDEELKAVIARDADDLFRFLAEEIASDRVQVDSPDRAMTWRDGESLFGARELMPLPVYHPAPTPPRPEGDLQKWKASFLDPWPKVIGDPERFLSNRLLYLIRKDLTDLEPVAWCHQALAIYIAGNEVKDLSPLSGLSNLKLIHAVRNPIESLAGVYNIPHLQTLLLDGTLVSDLTTLPQFPHLRELSLMGTPVTDLSPLANVKELEELNLPPGAVDLTPLAGLPKLKKLYLQKASEQALEALGSLLHLEEIDVQPAPNVRLDAIGNCKSLKKLKISDPKDEDTSFLSHLPNLEVLNLSDGHLKDLKGLENHPRLRLYGARETVVGDLSALTTCSGLTSVSATYPVFAYLHDKVPNNVDFSSINGGMTDEESEHWHTRVRERRDAWKAQQGQS